MCVLRCVFSYMCLSRCVPALICVSLCDFVVGRGSGRLRFDRLGVVGAKEGQEREREEEGQERERVEVVKVT